MWTCDSWPPLKKEGWKFYGTKWPSAQKKWELAAYWCCEIYIFFPDFRRQTSMFWPLDPIRFYNGCMCIFVGQTRRQFLWIYFNKPHSEAIAKTLGTLWFFITIAGSKWAGDVPQVVIGFSLARGSSLSRIEIVFVVAGGGVRRRGARVCVVRAMPCNVELCDGRSERWPPEAPRSGLHCPVRQLWRPRSLQGRTQHTCQVISSLRDTLNSRPSPQ